MPDFETKYFGGWIIRSYLGSFYPDKLPCFQQFRIYVVYITIFSGNHFSSLLVLIKNIAYNPLDNLVLKGN